MSLLNLLIGIIMFWIIWLNKGKVKQIMTPRLSHTVKQLKTTGEHTPWTRNPERKSGSSRQVGVFE